MFGIVYYKAFILMLVTLLTLNTFASDNRKKAKELYHSLTGVSAVKTELDYVEALIASGKYEQAASEIIDPPREPFNDNDPSNPINNQGAFYNITMKDFATPWSNEDETTLAPLNDMVATIIGFTRDDQSFDKIFYKNSVYKATGVVFQGEIFYFHKSSIPAKSTLPGVDSSAPEPSAICTETDGNKDYYMYHKDPTRPNDLDAFLCQLTKYPKNELDAYKLDNALYIPHIDTIVVTNRIKENNRHYESIDDLALNLADPSILKETSQDVKLHRTPEAIAGILSTRGFGAAYYTAGTNRAAFAFSMLNFMCHDMEELNDTTIPDFRNRRDIDRSPGGVSETYKNRCIGCHAGMDGMAGAFAYYDFNGAITYEYGVVVPKMNHNVVFADGFVTQTDSWVNLWTQGKNAAMGWGQPLQGNGVADLGRMFSTTDAFYKCMAQKVYNKVCFKHKALGNSTLESKVVKKNHEKFKSHKNMKTLFANTAVDCVKGVE